MYLKIFHISDTHTLPFKVEPADILIHSGDALNYGSMEDLIKFRKQLEEIYREYALILFTPGNHDWTFQDTPNYAKSFLSETIPNIKVLHNEAFEYRGYKFYGTADQPQFCNWAFNKPDSYLQESYSNIPEDTDVLITHCPPRGILDDLIRGGRAGSSELSYALPRLKKLKLHCFGHIHFGNGIFKNENTTFSNGAICNEEYAPLNKGNMLELS